MPKEKNGETLVSAREAVQVVQSGDLVYVPVATDPQTLEVALLSRKDELHDVTVRINAVLNDLPWYMPELAGSFKVQMGFVANPAAREQIIRNKTDIFTWLSTLALKPAIERPTEGHRVDVLFLEVSPPDVHGYCSCGHALWDKREQAEQAKTVLAEVNPSLVRTYGENYIHVSQLDYLVRQEIPPAPLLPRLEQQLSGRDSNVIKTIAQYVSTLIKDGDTISIGAGSTAESLHSFGVFEGKHDLGIHTERLPRGFIRLLRNNPDLFSGRFKTLSPGKIVVTLLALEEGDAEFVNYNPLFEVRSVYYVNNPRVIAAHDNMAAILGTLAIDLSGQVASEDLGGVVYAGPGGQPEIAVGALLSKGGRSIFVLPSTAQGGKVSRIVPVLQLGTTVTVPRTFTDYVVTEYGIARLLGKSLRERAEALISIAHPDFRSELRKSSRWAMDNVA